MKLIGTWSSPYTRKVRIVASEKSRAASPAQEFLQGFSKPKAHKQIIERFAALPLLVPDRDDYWRRWFRYRSGFRGVHKAPLSGARGSNAGKSWPLYRLRPVISCP
jgi:hypothetical protein